MPTGHAIVMTDVGHVEVQRVDVSEPEPDEVLIRTEYSGVSQGTEIWALTGKRSELRFPTVPGYQSIGIIEACGRDACGYEIGQRVYFTTSRLPEYMPKTWMGAHVSHALVSTLPRGARNEHTLVPIPDDVDPVAAAVSALAAVSLRGNAMVNIGFGDLVVVTGQGMIGQGSAQFARLRGATVVAADTNPTRIRLSKACSADVAVDVGTQKLADVVKELKPSGADVVIETTGRADMFAPCVDLLRWEGQLLLQGWYPEPITFDFNVTHQKKPTIAITCGHSSADVVQSLDLMRHGKLQYRELVTHRVPFTDAPGMYARMLANDPSVLGVVFDWRESQ